MVITSTIVLIILKLIVSVSMFFSLIYIQPIEETIYIRIHHYISYITDKCFILIGLIIIIFELGGEGSGVS